MNTKLVIREISLFLLTAIPVIYLLLNWGLLPEKMPTHFDFDGDPNGYGSKLVYVFLPLGVYLLMIVLPFIDPRKKNYELFSGTYFKLRVILCVLFGTIDTLVIYNTLHGIEKMGLLMPIIFYLLFTMLGNYMGTIRPNYFVGIKVPWTLNSDVVWIQTHKLAGKLWFWGGLVGIVSLFVIPKPEILMAIIIGTLVIVPIVYSYFIYQRIAKHEE
jgi:uncharacterized membrane protein